MSARRAASIGLATTLFAASVAAPAVADEAPDHAACARAYEQAQRHRQAHELKSARQDLLVCSRPECPAWVRHDCVPWLGDVDAAMPSIVVVAKNADGTTRSDVHVAIDGVPMAGTLTSDPIQLDPGEHVLVVDAGGVAKIEQHLKLREGERERRIEVTLAPVATAPPPPPPHHEELISPPPPRREEPDRPVPTLAWVLGGAGLFTTGLGAVFQVEGMSKRSDLFACAPRCQQSDVDSARSTLWVGNVLVGVGVLALAGAAVIYFTRPASPDDHAAVRVGPGFVAGAF